MSSASTPPAFGGSGGILRIDPLTGAQTTVSSGGIFADPLDIAIDAAGDLIVLDAEAFDLSKRVLRVDPLTGAQTTLSSGGNLSFPSGAAIFPVPEPKSALLFACGLLAMTLRRRHRHLEPLA